MKDNFLLRQKEPAQDLKPFCYSTDGGAFSDQYFIDKIFNSQTTVCHSSKVPKNANLQIYMGKSVDVDMKKIQFVDFKVKGNVNHLLIPYEKHFEDPDEEETFKLLDEL